MTLQTEDQPIIQYHHHLMLGQKKLGYSSKRLFTEIVFHHSRIYFHQWRAPLLLPPLDLRKILGMPMVLSHTFIRDLVLSPRHEIL